LHAFFARAHLNIFILLIEVSFIHILFTVIEKGESSLLIACRGGHSIEKIGEVVATHLTSHEKEGGLFANSLALFAIGRASK
jgi:hypothetical protein